jgi:hypothetical protein
LLMGALPLAAWADTATWDGYAGNAQHTALLPTGATPSQALNTIKWQAGIDLAPQYSGSDLLIHYGSPMIDAANTIVVPVKTGATGGFELQAFNGATGAAKWTVNTDYALPPSGWDWTPSYSPTLVNQGPTQGRLYYAVGGGAVNWINSIDSTPGTPTQIFVGGNFNSNITVNTPLTSDGSGNVYFGFQSTDPLHPSGLARIDASGNVTTVSASSVGAGLSQVVTNSAPAVGANGAVYVAMSNGNFGTGQLVELNASSLSVMHTVALLDPKYTALNSAPTSALLPNDGTASPVIGPDGDVYMGVFDRANTSRGWMEHYSADLTITKPTGGFGWDDTPSIVPASMVPSYHGTSSYLLMTKYNNYGETGGQGQNMLALLDPNATETDPRINSTGMPIMRVVESILGPTPDPNFDGIWPDAVREWCINSAVVDPTTDSVLAGSEDGKLYRWDLATNTFTQVITLTPGIGEAYTPTLVGPDGTVYAINNATLFAVGVPEPATAGVLVLGALGLLARRGQKRRSCVGLK